MLQRRNDTRNQLLGGLPPYNNSWRRAPSGLKQIQFVIFVVVVIIFGTCLVAVNYEGSRPRMQQELERKKVIVNGKANSAIPQPIVPKIAEIKSLIDGKSLADNPRAEIGSPLSRVAVVLVCNNRPDYLERTLGSISSIWRFNNTLSNVEFSLIFSQDGSHVGVTNIIERFIKSSPQTKHINFHYDPNLWQAKYSEPFMQNLAVYYRISAHYDFIFSSIMKDNEDFSYILLVEDDMLLAPDFFHYFAAASKYLQRYKSVLCVSSWNDNGQEAFVEDPGVLFRTDVFPGLGWMISREVALELLEKWPAGFWDDWLRDPAQRKGRSCVFPEINRAKTFGSEGSSKGEFFDQYLAPMRLNSKNVDWILEDKMISVFNESTYNETLWRQVNNATSISIEDLTRVSSAGGNGMFRIDYRSESEFQIIAQRLNCMPDWKSGIPRASYQGISQLRIQKSRLFLIKKN